MEKITKIFFSSLFILSFSLTQVSAAVFTIGEDPTVDPDPISPNITFPSNNQEFDSNTTSVTIEWEDNDDNYLIRAQDITDPDNPIKVFNDINNQSTNTKKIDVSAGKTYKFWVHSGTISNYSEPYSQVIFSVAEEEETTPPPSTDSNTGGGGGGGGGGSKDDGKLSIKCNIPDPKVAPGSSILIEAEIKNGKSPYTIEWYGDAEKIEGFDLSDNSQVVKFEDKASYVLKVKVKDGNRDTKSDDCPTIRINQKYDTKETDSSKESELPKDNSTNSVDGEKLQKLTTLLTILKAQNEITQQQYDLIILIFTAVSGGVTTNSVPSGQITKSFTLGQSDPQVRTLQQKLNNLGFTISYSGPGSKGNESTYFGSLTQQALIRFQISKGLPGTGILDQTTRNYLNQN